ncbi:uncharacterized protein [Ptychodera flava]|uniref:uncharacterized protein n=1 Tax=Ptychodera flava TaxID=63121 RepID=UPI00396A8D1B
MLYINMGSACTRVPDFEKTPGTSFQLNGPKRPLTHIDLDIEYSSASDDHRKRGRSRRYREFCPRCDRNASLDLGISEVEAALVCEDLDLPGVPVSTRRASDPKTCMINLMGSKARIVNKPSTRDSVTRLATECDEELFGKAMVDSVDGFEMSYLPNKLENNHRRNSGTSELNQCKKRREKMANRRLEKNESRASLTISTYGDVLIVEARDICDSPNKQSGWDEQELEQGETLTDEALFTRRDSSLTLRCVNWSENSTGGERRGSLCVTKNINQVGREKWAKNRQDSLTVLLDIDFTDE